MFRFLSSQRIGSYERFTILTSKISIIRESDSSEFEKYSSEFSEENNNTYIQNYSIPDIPERLLEEESINEGVEENINLMKFMSFWQNALRPSVDTPKENSGKGINIVIGKFQPFNNGHLDACKEIYATNNKPIIIIQVHNERKGDSRPYSTELSSELLNEVVNSHDIFGGAGIVKKCNMGSINELLDDKYHPLTIGANENYVRHLRNSINDKNIELLELKKYIDEDSKLILNKDINEIIKNDDYLTFKERVPECLHNFFEKMKQELK